MQLAPAAFANDYTPAQLASQADLVARARVMETHSFWSADGSTIESVSTLKLTQRFKGDAATYILVHTVGGFLVEEGLGMMRAHEAAFTAGEDVLLFAELYKDGYRLVEGAAGKYDITGTNFINRSAATRGSLQALLDELACMACDRDYAPAGTRFAKPRLPSDPLTSFTQQYFIASAPRKWAVPNAIVPFRVHVNTEQAGRDDGNHADFLQAIQDAAMTWNRVSDADFTLQYAGQTESVSTEYNGVNEIVFMHKGLGERGAVAQVWYKRDLTLVEADIWINDDYDWNTRGDLEAHELDLQSALLHEFGHWLVLGHGADASTVMYPKLAAGVQKRTLEPADAHGISAIYPCQSTNCGGDSP